MLLGQLVEKVCLEPRRAVDSSLSVHESMLKMAQMNVGALLVQSEEIIVGVFSERDYARSVLLVDYNPMVTRVDAIMTRNVVFAEYSMTLERCLELMVENGIRHLPVNKNNICIGFITIIEVVEQLLGSRDFMIDQLNKFITGSQYVDGLTNPVCFKKVS